MDRFLAGTLKLEDRWLTRRCFVASFYEDVYRTGEIARYSMLRDGSPTTDLRALVKAVPAYVVADIAAQMELAQPVSADFIIDGLLLDCKATTTPTRLGSTEIGQLAGYLLLDYDDHYRITQVGLYLSRQGTAITWQVREFLRLIGTDEPLPQLRGLLREYLRRQRYQ